VSDPSDEKAPQQVGPDKPPRERGSGDDQPPPTKELPTAEATEAEKSEDVQGPEDFGPTTEYGTE
jgi:hypothetical protein